MDFFAYYLIRKFLFCLILTVNLFSNSPLVPKRSKSSVQILGLNISRVANQTEIVVRQMLEGLCERLMIFCLICFDIHNKIILIMLYI